MKLKLSLSVEQFKSLNTWLMLAIAQHIERVDPLAYILLEELSGSILKKMISCSMDSPRKVVKVGTNIFAVETLLEFINERCDVQSAYFRSIIEECQRAIKEHTHQLEAYKNSRTSNIRDIRHQEELGAVQKAIAEAKTQPESHEVH